MMISRASILVLLKVLPSAHICACVARELESSLSLPPGVRCASSRMQLLKLWSANPMLGHITECGGYKYSGKNKRFPNVPGPKISSKIRQVEVFWQC